MSTEYKAILRHNWRPVKYWHNDLPHDESIFLAIWKGRICLAQYAKDEGRFFISYEPAIAGHQKVEQDRNYKFTYWMPLDWNSQ